MKIIKKCLTFCLLLLAGMATAQQGKVIEEQTVKSKILKRNVKYTIYLPADYETANRTYPVVYLLHGYTDDNTGWLQFGEVNRYADKAIAEGTIPPMIIVMPNADSSWYINSYDGKEKYEDFFIKEFMPKVEQAYRIKTDRQYRAVAGLSMGGYGTMVYAIKYPQLFSSAAALSAAVFPDDQMINQPDENYDHVFGQLFGRGLKGKDRINKAWQENSVLNLVQNKTTEELSKVRYWIDCGDDDFLTIGNGALHAALIEKKVPHEYRVRDGAHNWTYWRTGITNALVFIGDTFRQK
jgi:S-formylglutathione hydrolase FrmB